MNTLKLPSGTTGFTRGCQLYILRQSDLSDGAILANNYTRGFAVCD